MRVNTRLSRLVGVVREDRVWEVSECGDESDLGPESGDESM